MLLLMIAQLASGTTTCTPQPGLLTCSTQHQQPQQGGSPGWMMDLATNKAGREVQAQQQQDDDGAANRRAAAYSQVGALIAKGDCDGAKRLARFYGHSDIIKATARACP